MSAVQQILLAAGQGVTVSIENAYVFNGLYGAASYRLEVDGNIYHSPFGLVGPWISKPSASSLYEARMNLIGVSILTPTGAPLGTWINLGTGPDWSFSGFTSGNASCILEIRRVSAPLQILDSATIDFEYLGSFA